MQTIIFCNNHARFLYIYNTLLWIYNAHIFVYKTFFTITKLFFKYKTFLRLQNKLFYNYKTFLQVQNFFTLTKLFYAYNYIWPLFDPIRHAMKPVILITPAYIIRTSWNVIHTSGTVEQLIISGFRKWAWPNGSGRGLNFPPLRPLWRRQTKFGTHIEHTKTHKKVSWTNFLRPTGSAPFWQQVAILSLFMSPSFAYLS